jgi:cell division protein FtsB
MPGVLHSGAWRTENVFPGSEGGMKRLFIVLLLLLVYLQFRLWFGDGSLQEVWQLHREVEEQREENVRLRERNDALDAEVRDLQQGLDAIEERAREDLGMIREGETFYQVVE